MELGKLRSECERAWRQHSMETRRLHRHIAVLESKLASGGGGAAGSSAAPAAAAGAAADPILAHQERMAAQQAAQDFAQELRRARPLQAQQGASDDAAGAAPAWQACSYLEWYVSMLTAFQRERGLGGLAMSACLKEVMRYEAFLAAARGK